MRLLRALAPIAAAVLLALGAAELVVRLAFPQLAVLPAPGQKPNRFSPDDVLGYRLDRSAHWVQNGDRGEFAVDYWTTPAGFRTSAPGAPACAGREILCVGNSFVEGWGLAFEKSFLKVAQVALAQAGKPWCLANYGMSGYSACQSWLLVRELLREKARPVVFFVTPGTAFDDAEFLRGANVDAHGLATGVDVMKLGAPRPGPPPPAALALAERLRPTLESLALFRMVLRSLRNRYEVQRIVPGDPATDRFFLTREGVDYRKPLEDTMRHIAAMQAACAQAHVPLLAVLVPYGHQVAGYEWSEGRLRQKLEAGRVYPAGGLGQIGARLAAAGVPVLDLLPALKAASKPERHLYFTLDIHLNEAGNAVVAAELARWLAARPELAN